MEQAGPPRSSLGCPKAAMEGRQNVIRRRSPQLISALLHTRAKRCTQTREGACSPPQAAAALHGALAAPAPPCARLPSSRPASMFVHADAATCGRLGPRIADQAAGTRPFERADSRDEALDARPREIVSKCKLCLAISVRWDVCDLNAAAATAVERRTRTRLAPLRDKGSQAATWVQ